MFDIPLAPDYRDVSNAALIENAACECCGRNSFLQEELLKIDSGRHLCPDCLAELQGGAGGGMKQWCIDRHSKKINMINKSLSVESVPLQALWQIPWDKNCQKRKEGVVLPSQ